MMGISFSAEDGLVGMEFFGAAVLIDSLWTSAGGEVTGTSFSAEDGLVGMEVTGTSLSESPDLGASRNFVESGSVTEETLVPEPWESFDLHQSASESLAALLHSASESCSTLGRDPSVSELLVFLESGSVSEDTLPEVLSELGLDQAGSKSL